MECKGFGSPIIILVAAVALVIAGVAALVYLGDVAPLPNSGGPAGENVLLIGRPSESSVLALSGSEARMRGINAAMPMPPGAVNLAVLKAYKVVILQGDQYFEMGVRRAIGEYVRGGGRLIVVGNAGSRHPQYENVAGWSWPAGQGIPVPVELTNQSIGGVNGTNIVVLDTGHYITQGMIWDYPMNITNVTRIVLIGKPLVGIKTLEGEVPALVEGMSGLGTVIYFSYDPGQTPEMFLVSIKYLLAQ